MSREWERIMREAGPGLADWAVDTTRNPTAAWSLERQDAAKLVKAVSEICLKLDDLVIQANVLAELAAQFVESMSEAWGDDPPVGLVGAITRVKNFR